MRDSAYVEFLKARALQFNQNPWKNSDISIEEDLQQALK